MAFTASSHPPIEKHPEYKADLIVSEFQIASVSIFEFSKPPSVDHYEFGDITVNMHVDYDKVGLRACYLMPKGLKNKDHRPWLFYRVKTC
jgi:hypothetical protein